MNYDALLQKALDMEAAASDRDDVTAVDYAVVAFLLDHCEITVPETAEFFVRVNVGDGGKRIAKKLRTQRLKKLREEFYTQAHKDAGDCYAFSANDDFGHTAPAWENIMKLGLMGLRRRVAERVGPQENPAFTKGLTEVFDAAQRFMYRAAEAADAACKPKMAAGIRHLAVAPPSNLFEGFQMTLVFYCLQQYFDGTDIRTMGRLDQLLQPFYENEPDKAAVAALAEQYMREIDAIQAAANMPLALGGVDEYGKSRICDMSYVLLKAYEATKLSETKIHVLCSRDMPRDFLEICFRCIKDGGNSLVFVNSKSMVDGLVKLGLKPADAAAFAIVGCYEASGREEVPCSYCGRFSLPKALEVTLHGGRDAITGSLIGVERPVDFETYEDLFAAFRDNVIKFAEGAMELGREFESRYPRLHASPFFSACLTSCVERGADAYTNYGAAYNNSSISVVGIGTVTDSLYAIRKLVYEDKRMTLAQLIAVLDSNWQGQEVLRGIIRNKFPKYGNANKEVDAIAQRIFRLAADTVNGTPNAKGGVYRLGVYSITRRLTWGAHTAASADGRFDGETLSQNASATFGMDREGTTGHILSVASLDGSEAVNGCVLDLDFHSSAVRGENGSKALLATLETFMEAGGQTVHYNVLDTETLRDAQVHPERYPNLQVRLCGWNVLFTQLSKESQDEFIRRSEMLAG